MVDHSKRVIIRSFPGLTPYETSLKTMQDFSLTRDANSIDELWIVEHLPVFTLGQAGKKEHLIAPGDIPVIQSDRGGQVTYHGPGQLVVYVLLNLNRKAYHIRQLVCKLEEAMIQYLLQLGINAQRKAGAPGIYVDDAKMGSIGLRIRRGFSYHGLSFNVDMDLAAFSRINPCGFPNLKITQLKDWLDKPNFLKVSREFISVLATHLEYDELIQ
jgi:lipoyl(octanoyl) transferase